MQLIVMIPNIRNPTSRKAVRAKITKFDLTGFIFFGEYLTYSGNVRTYSSESTWFLIIIKILLLIQLSSLNWTQSS